jgi:hypothetical protein
MAMTGQFRAVQNNVGGSHCDFLLLDIDLAIYSTIPFIVLKGLH